MSSGKPVVRQIAWRSFIPQLLVYAVLCVLFLTFIKPELRAIEFAIISYLVISVILKTAIPRSHRKGIALYKTGKYEHAIAEFEKSYVFFTKNAWIDKYRFITMLSSSRISYREMALLNIAFCYSQIGDGKNAKAYYLKVLDEFPDSAMAKSSLKMIESIETSNL